MKKLFFILFCLSYLNIGFSFNGSLNPTAAEISSFPKPPLDPSLSPSTYSYFTVGSGLLMHKIGAGWRYRNCDTCKGSDVSVNMHFSMPMTLNDFNPYRPPILPSLKYTSLYYRDNSPTSRYFGISYEALLIPLDPKSGLPFLPLPNLGLIWGKERETVRFSQLQFNIFPAIGCILGAGILLTPDGDYDHLLGATLVLGCATTLFSYNVAF